MTLVDALMPVIESEPRLLDVAADAHATLGSVHLLDEDNEAAIAEFETASEIAPDLDSKREFFMALAFVYECGLGLSDTADAYLEEANSLPGDPIDTVVCPAP